MIGYVEAPMAWGHTHGMARLLGVDLAGAVVDGWLQRAELAALVATCQSCGATPCCSDWLAQTDAQPLTTLTAGERQRGLHLDEHGVYTLHADGPLWNSSSRYRLAGQQVVPVGVSYYYLPHLMIGFALALAVIALLRWLFRRWLRRRQERDQATWLNVSSH